jgi:hypothetical protein
MIMRVRQVIGRIRETCVNEDGDEDSATEWGAWDGCDLNSVRVMD